MKVVAKVVLGCAALYLVLMLGSGLAIRALLSTELGDRIRARAQQSLPVEVSLSGGSFDIGEWMLFRPALALHDLRVGNPEGFGEDALLSAGRVFARAGLMDLLRGDARIAAIEIDAPTLHIQTNTSGRTNLQALLSAIRAPSDDEDSSDTSDFAIDSLRISAGSIIYASPDEPDFIAKNLTVAADDISLDEFFRFSASLDLFEESAVSVRFDGFAGPFSPGSLPADGDLSVHAAPGRIPASFRRQALGVLLEDPGAASSFDISVDLEGDLFGVVAGAGNVSFDDIRLGHEGVDQFPLSGQAELLLTLLDPIANPSFHVIMPDAGLDFGQGRWQGGIEAQYDGQLLSGKSAGAIDGVNIHEMMSAFTDTPDVAFGTFKMPRYELRFSGRDADQIFRSLTGDGRIELTDGGFAVFDTLETIQGHARKLLSGSSATSGETHFIEFNTDLQVRDERVHVSGIALQSDQLRIAGAGSFGFDQSLDFDLRSSVSGALAELLGGARDESGAAWVGVPLRVRGSVADPSVSPDLARLIRGEAVRRAAGLLDALINDDDAAAGEEPEPAPRLPFDLGEILRRKLTGDESQ